MNTLGQSTWTDSAGSHHVNDICLGEGGTDFALATGESAYESIITDVIRTLKGEIQLDLDLGMDYEATVWANLKKIGEWKRQVTNRVLELDFVQSIISFEAFAKDGTLRYELNVQTDLGNDTISGGVSMLKGASEESASESGHLLLETATTPMWLEQTESAESGSHGLRKALGQSTWTDSEGSHHVNDICLGEGGTDFALATGEVAYESIITDVIRTLKGEIQLDLDLGMDYEATVWANLKKIGEWKRQVTNRVLELDFVQSIISFEAFAQDGTLRYELNVQTDLGNDTISGGVSLLSRTKVLTSDNIVLSSSTFSYSGAEQRPILSVVFDGKELTEEVDYTVSFPSESRTVGVKQIFVYGRGKYSGTAATAYEIEPYDLSLGATCPTFVIYHDTSEAVPEGGRFSDIVYDNYGNVVTYKPRRYWYDVKTLGRHEMVLDGNGNYTGSCSFTYYTRVNIGDEFWSGAYISLNQKVFTYDQAFHKPTSATIAIPGQDVSLDRVAITVEATAQKATGRYTATVTAVGDFVYGTREVSFYVTDYLAFEFKEPWKLDDVDEKGYGLTFVNGRAYWDWLEVSNDLTTWEDWTEDYEGGTTGDLYYNPLSNPYGLDGWFPSVVFIRGRQKNVRSEDSEVYFTTCATDRDNQLKCNVYGSMSAINKYRSSLTPYCYKGLFEKFNTETAPALPATELAEGCYEAMFKDCKELCSAPEIPATTLADRCCQSMFEGCINLTAHLNFKINAETLSPYCFKAMFKNCLSLKYANMLAFDNVKTNDVGSCYEMFSGCKSLATSFYLGWMTLAKSCYEKMFYGCVHLAESKGLSQTTLAERCYAYMFYGCKEMTVAYPIAATTLATNCCYAMFKKCEKLHGIEVSFTTWGYCGDWVSGVSSSGTFKAPADLPDERGVNRIPAGWTLVRTS